MPHIFNTTPNPLVLTVTMLLLRFVSYSLLGMVTWLTTEWTLQKNPWWTARKDWNVESAHESPTSELDLNDIHSEESLPAHEVLGSEEPVQSLSDTLDEPSNNPPLMVSVDTTPVQPINIIDSDETPASLTPAELAFGASNDTTDA